MAAAFSNEALSKLRTDDQLALLDSIDRLRLQGISKYVSLPQIIVCGDQSSGKSSVLEALSGVSFPIKSSLCTRFPTELVLRRAPHFSARVSIIPDESRSEGEKVSLREFRAELRGFNGLPEVVEQAKLAMGITPHGRSFAKDILRVEVTGPNRPHLTIVDLPGLIHTETKTQTRHDVELIQDLVQSYMRQSRCIILAIVSAKNDFANQVVLKLAREADPLGNRTLGVITKPDTLVPGGESENLFISLANNQEVFFKHGWHVVKNMDSEEGEWTHEQRDAEETKFFETSSWKGLRSSCLGIAKLRGRLSRLLLGHIATELPSLMSEINKMLETCRNRLEELGDPRANTRDQRAYLLQVSHVFQTLVTTSVGGHYDKTDDFFESALTEEGYQQRLRAIIQNLNEDFAEEMRTKGHYREIVDKLPDKKPSRPKPGRPIPVTREEFIIHIQQLMRRARGFELPGTFNPLLVRDLFHEQSQPWEAIVRRHVENVWKAACRFIKLVVTWVADETTAKSLQHEVIDPAMKAIFADMRDKTSELLFPQQNDRPITYDQEFVETLEQLRRERQQKQTEEIFSRYFGVRELENVKLQGTYDLTALAELLVISREPDVRKAAANDLLDCLNAYYKVRTCLSPHFAHLLPKD